MSNEKLIAPKPASDIADMQAAAMPIAEEVGYTYQRSDGTVERAANAQEAIARCPVLGRLAIEAPDQANVLLELAATGKEKMAAEAKEGPPKPKTEEKIDAAKQKQTKKVKPEKHAPVVQAKQIHKTDPTLSAAGHAKEEQQPLRPGLTAHYQTELPRQQTQEKGDMPTVKNVAETRAMKEAQYEETARQDDTNTPQPLKTEMQPTQSPARRVEISTYKNEAIAETRVVVGGNDSLVETTRYEPADTASVATDPLEVALPINAEDGDTEEAFEVDPSEPFQLAVMEGETVVDDINEEIAEKTMDEQLELLFEPETIETYRQLTALAADTEVDEVILLEAKQVESDALIGSELETDTEGSAVTDFETFIAVQPATNEPITLEANQEQANDRPLEQTFVQLVAHLSESLEESEQGVLLEILQEIEKALPACYIHPRAVEAEPKPRITPEITEKLLTLLRTLGYENPREALVGFVTKYGLVFLLQALEYMCRLNSEDNRQEFLSSSASVTTADDYYTPHLFGKTVLHLLAIPPQGLPRSS